MKRKELKAGTVLNSKYSVYSVKGVGANAIVYSANYWDNDVEHDILIKELFPFDGNAERSETSDGLIWNSDGTDWERIKKQAIDTYRYTQEIYRKTGFASAPVTYECFEENNTLYYAVIPNIGAEECSKHTFNSLM